MKPLDLIWSGHRQVCGSYTQENSIEVVCKRIQIEEEIQRALPASPLFSAMPPLEAVKVLVSTMMSVSLSNKGKPLKLRHYDISKAHSKELPRDSCTSSFPQRIVRNMAKTKLADWSRACTELKTLPTSGNKNCEPDPWRERRLPKRQTQRSIVPQSESRCENRSARR